jgi:hypothetical protein
MTRTYLVRAKLGWREDSYRVPKLPVKFGQFLLNYSPNNELWCIAHGFVDPDPAKGLPQEDKDYPVSLIYVETAMEEVKGQHPGTVADETLKHLEAMLRLFQAGYIFLQRHTMLELEQGVPPSASKLFPVLPIWWTFPPPVKAEPDALYRRREYKLNDGTLAKFIEFFNSYWDVIRSNPQPLCTAICRFNRSYGDQTLDDRLLQLMMAMEALFGSSSGTSIRNKVSSGCATLLYPPGPERAKVSKDIKDFYGERSRISHTGKLATKFSNDELDQFEQYARISIVKLLQLIKGGHPITSST